MVYRLLLAFGLLSTLMIDVDVAVSARSVHESMTTALSTKCNPKNPNKCPQVYMDYES